MAVGQEWAVFVLFVLSVSAELSPLSSFVTPVGVGVLRSGERRTVTVLYQADSQPLVRWAESSTWIEETADLGLSNDFDEVSGGGQASISMSVGHFWSDPPKLKAHLLMPEFTFMLELRKNILNSNVSYDMNPVYFDIGQHDVLEYVKGEELRFTESIRSLDMNRLNVSNGHQKLEAFDYALDPPEVLQYWSTSPADPDSDNPLVCEDFEETNSTSTTKSCRLDTTADYVSGKMSIDVILKPRRNRVLKNIYISRIFYVKEVGHGAPYRENSLVVRRLPSRLVDKELSNRYPYFTYTAIGYPRPEIWLEHGCQGVPDVNTTHVQSSRYATVVEFRFPPVSESDLLETYVIVAKSGTYEIADFYSVERNR